MNILVGHFNDIVTAAHMQFQSPTIGWSPPPQLQNWCRNLAFVAIIAWIVYYVAKVLAPGRRGMGGGRGEGGKLIAAAVAILVLMDIKGLPDTVNLILKAIWYVGATLHFPGVSHFLVR